MFSSMKNHSIVSNIFISDVWQWSFLFPWNSSKPEILCAILLSTFNVSVQSIMLTTYLFWYIAKCDILKLKLTLYPWNKWLCFYLSFKVFYVCYTTQSTESNTNLQNLEKCLQFHFFFELIVYHFWYLARHSIWADKIGTIWVL